MTFYRGKPMVVEAHRWFENGDHPDDDCHTLTDRHGPFLSEGKVVRFYKPEPTTEDEFSPPITGETRCGLCRMQMQIHGWIDVPEKRGYVVCPGNWILTDVDGNHFPCTDSHFKRFFEPA